MSQAKKRVRSKIRKLLNEGYFTEKQLKKWAESNSDPSLSDIVVKSPDGSKRNFESYLQDLSAGEDPDGKDEDDDRQILLDDGFVQGLVSRLQSYDVSSLDPGDLQSRIEKLSIKRMFQSDDKDEYYNYKTRYQKAPDIAKVVMHAIQRGKDRADQEGDPVFVDYENVGNDMKIFEKARSKSQQRLMGMVYKYKNAKKNNNTEEIHDLFYGIPKSLEKKIKRIADEMSMGDVEDYADTEHTGLPDDIDEEKVLDEFRNKLREKLPEIVTNEIQNKDIKEGMFSSDAEDVKREFKKVVKKGEPRRFEGMTIDPRIAQKVLDISSQLSKKEEETFFQRPVRDILAIATHRLN